MYISSDLSICERKHRTEVVLGKIMAENIKPDIKEEVLRHTTEKLRNSVSYQSR